MQNFVEVRDTDYFLLIHNCDYHNLQKDICDYNKKNTVSVYIITSPG